jgi:hypothetical protein
MGRALVVVPKKHAGISEGAPAHALRKPLEAAVIGAFDLGRKTARRELALAQVVV